MRIEILKTEPGSSSAKLMLSAMADACAAAGDDVNVTSHYAGGADLLILFGVGHPANNWARHRQIKKGGRVLMWDLGYFGPRRLEGYLRMSIDHDHPQAFLDRTPIDGSRWDAHGIELREDGNPDGPIILVGLGKKSRSYLQAGSWERDALQRIQKQHPGKRVIFRPKGNDSLVLKGVEVDRQEDFRQVLKGASLVVARHSNCCVDAAIAGVPFQCEDGAAMWLSSRPFTRDNRRDFLSRLSWWQWKASEASSALQFAKGIL